VRFTERRTSLLTQASQLRHSSLATTTVADAATIVVVAAVADAERTSNCNSTYKKKGWHHASPSLFYLPYLTSASLRMFLFPDRVASIISTISAGETMNGFFGKCLRLPVTRKESSLLRATS